MRTRDKNLEMDNVEKIGEVSKYGRSGENRKIGNIGLLIGLILLLLASSAGAVSTLSFPDIKGHWGEKYIEWGVNQGLVKGYPDGTYQPNKSLSEAEFATMMTSFAVNASVTGAASAHWSDPYYTAMNKFNLPFKGYTNISFRDKPVDRGTIAQIVASKNGFDLPLALAIQYMYDNELSQGMDANVQNFNTYGADKSLTRAEAVTFLERLNSIGATSFMGIPSPTTDGRHVLSQAERDVIHSQVKSKVNEWLVNNKGNLPAGQLAEIENWIKDKGDATKPTTNANILPAEMAANPLVIKAIASLPEYSNSPNTTWETVSGNKFTAQEIVNHAVGYMNYRYNYDGKNMVEWNKIMKDKYEAILTSPEDLSGKSMTSISYADMSNIQAKGNHWIVDVITLETNTGKVYISEVKIGTVTEKGKLYANDISTEEVK